MTSMSRLARQDQRERAETVLSRMVGVCKRALWIAEHPKGDRSVGQCCHADILAESHSQWAMLRRIIQRTAALYMAPPKWSLDRSI